MKQTVTTHLLYVVLASLLLALAAASCAKPTAEDNRVFESEAFEAWMAKYVLPEKQGVIARQSNGMWVEVVADGEPSSSSVLDTIVWVRLNYTSRDGVSKNVFRTRDSMEAFNQRTFTAHTCYEPQFVVCAPENYGMIEGQHFALRNPLLKPDGTTINMRKGSYVRLWMPSYLAYGTNGFSDDQGYGGQNALGGSKIVVHDLVVEEVIKNPVKNEEDSLRLHVKYKWGINPETDTITKHFYIDSVKFKGDERLAEKYKYKEFNKSTDEITTSTAVKIWFIGRFLPSTQYPEGFIFDTNIKEVYDSFYDRDQNRDYYGETRTHSVVNYTAEGDDSSKYPAAFKKAIPALRRGIWCRIAFVSAYGWGQTGFSSEVRRKQKEWQDYANYINNSMMYGNYGSYYPTSSTSGAGGSDEQKIVTEIQPFTPLIYEIYIEPAKED